MPEADETIITRFVAETADAVANAERYREEIDKIKAAALDMSTSNKVALKDLQAAWIALAEQQKAAAVAQAQKATVGPLGEGLDAQAVQANVKAIADQYDAMIARIKVAFGEARAEEKQYFASQAAIIKETNKQTTEDAKASVQQRLAVIKQTAQFQTELEKQAQAEVRAQNKETAAAINEYARITKQGYGVMSEGAKQYGMQVQAVKQQIQQIASSTGTSFQQAAQQLQAAGVPANQINQALKELNPTIKTTGQSFRIFGQEINNIGDIARVVFLGLFGVTVFQIMRNIVNYFKDAAVAGYEFAKSIFSLEVGARALQRAGVDVTIKQIYEQLGSMQERFRIFTTKDLIVGTAAFLNLNRDMGFTRDQLFKLQDAIATLAIVNGRAMDEVQKTVALALSSGYTEGLQRLGVSINRVTIANEAARLGFAKSYMALNEQQRALATYNLIIQKTAIYQEDLQKYYQTAPGAIDRTKTSFQELKNQIGLLVATNLGTYLTEVWKFLDQINKGIESFKNTRFARWIGEVTDNLNKFNETADTTQTLLKNVLTWIVSFAVIRALPSPFSNIIASLERILSIKGDLDAGILGDEAVNNTKKNADAISKALDDVADMGETAIKSRDDALLKAQTDFERDLNKILQDAQADQIKMEQDYGRDIEKIDRDLTQKLEDLWVNYERRKAELQTKYEADVAAAALKYQQDVAQTIRDFAQRRADAEREYRLNEIIAEKKFQEDMRRLREGFLLDLEDALHERDARQVLRLIRQYNLQKTQLTRQNNLEKDERKLRFEEELKDLEIQKQERLRTLAEEYQARLAELKRTLEAELAAEALKYKQAQEDARRDAEQRKEERLIEYNQEIMDLVANIIAQRIARGLQMKQQTDDILAEYDRRLAEIGQKLAAELSLTTVGAEAVHQALLAYYGPGGAADQIFAYYVASAQAAAAAAQAALLSVFGGKISFGGKTYGKEGTSTEGGTGGGGARKGKQEGGIVRKGNIEWVGEQGPEPFIPAVNGRILSVKQSQEALAQAYAPTGGRGEGRIKIGVELSPELVGEIQDNTLDAIAGVVFELERKRK